mgnify:FL=1
MENKTQKGKYISVQELADMLGISRIAVFKKIKKGQIPAERFGRSYAIPRDYASESGGLTEYRRAEIERAVGKVVKEYGETLKLLGKE